MLIISPGPTVTCMLSTTPKRMNVRVNPEFCMQFLIMKSHVSLLVLMDSVD